MPGLYAVIVVGNLHPFMQQFAEYLDGIATSRTPIDDDVFRIQRNGTDYHFVQKDWRDMWPFRDSVRNTLCRCRELKYVAVVLVYCFDRLSVCLSASIEYLRSELVHKNEYMFLLCLAPVQTLAYFREFIDETKLQYMIVQQRTDNFEALYEQFRKRLVTVPERDQGMIIDDFL